MKKIRVHIKTGYKNSRVVLEGDIYKVFVKSLPKEGKANEELVEVLSEHFHIPKSNIEIKRGLKSRSKIVFIFE